MITDSSCSQIFVAPAHKPLMLGTSPCMTEYLVAARAAIVLWTNPVMPAEILFDAIEAELERRGVEQ